MILSLTQARRYTLMCSSFNRLETIIDLDGRLEWEDWLALLGEEWQSCDNIAQYADHLMTDTPFADVVEVPSLGRWMMTPEECAALAALPDTVTVYRGCYARNKRGLSWSIDRSVAERFPFIHRYRQAGQALLVRGEVQREHVIAVKLDRQEHELIIAPWRVKIRAISHAQDRLAAMGTGGLP